MEDSEDITINTNDNEQVYSNSSTAMDEETENDSDSDTDYQPARTTWKCFENGCKKSFKHKKSLIFHHRQFHLKDENLQCSVCEKHFSSKANLNVHTRIHTGWNEISCKIKGCTETFRTSHFLREHMKKAHSDVLKDKNVPEIKCQYCQKTFASERSKRLHVEGHLVKGRILCLICNKEYYNSETFNVHMKTHTGEKGKATEKILNSNKCPFCTKRFLSKREVRDHCLLNHKDFKGFPCPICEKFFIGVTALQTHKKVHTVERTFQCTECDAKFKTSSHCQEHLSRHSQSFTFRCPVCPKGFFRQQKLDVHLNRFHRPTIDMRCDRSRQRDAAKHREFIMPEPQQKKEVSPKETQKIVKKRGKVNKENKKLQEFVARESSGSKKEHFVEKKENIQFNKLALGTQVNRCTENENKTQSGPSKIYVEASQVSPLPDLMSWMKSKPKKNSRQWLISRFKRETKK